jgi:hypothetical protein
MVLSYLGHLVTIIQELFKNVSSCLSKIKSHITVLSYAGHLMQGSISPFALKYATLMNSFFAQYLFFLPLKKIYWPKVGNENKTSCIRY